MPQVQVPVSARAYYPSWPVPVPDSSASRLITQPNINTDLRRYERDSPGADDPGAAGISAAPIFCLYSNRFCSKFGSFKYSSSALTSEMGAYPTASAKL